MPGHTLHNKIKSLCVYTLYPIVLWILETDEMDPQYFSYAHQKPKPYITSTKMDGGEGAQTLKYICTWAFPKNTKCVRNFDDSRDTAIHTRYHISLCSSSLCEPRHPLLKVIISPI